MSIVQKIVSILLNPTPFHPLPHPEFMLDDHGNFNPNWESSIKFKKYQRENPFINDDFKKYIRDAANNNPVQLNEILKMNEAVNKLEYKILQMENILGYHKDFLKRQSLDDDFQEWKSDLQSLND